MITSIKTFNNRAPLRLFLLIPFVLACFTLAPQARAVCQEGCLANGNTVLGDDALLKDTVGNNNTAVGFEALFSNTNGNVNTAIGSGAPVANTGGAANTAIGYNALGENTGGGGNVAVGNGALAYNTVGFLNTASGPGALEFNTTGAYNTADGSGALGNNASGILNTANGYQALYRNTTGDNNIDIGNAGVAGEAGVIRIGTTGTQTATFVAGIRGVPISGGTEVGVNSNGQLGVSASSARYKDAIKPMDKASEAILMLKPVTFRYKHELDAKGHPAVWPRR